MTTPEEIKDQFQNAVQKVFDNDTYDPHPTDVSLEQMYVSKLMSDFTDMRVSRAQLLGSLYDFNDPNVLAHILGDMVTLIENMHIAMNPMPEDGFVSLTPKDDNGSDSTE